MGVSEFIPTNPLTVSPLDCFQSFPITNRAAINKGVIGHFAFVQVYLKDSQKQAC